MVASLSQSAMVKQHRAIGITATRCCGYPRRCNLKTDSHPRNGNRITLRTPTLVRWVRCYCQADGISICSSYGGAATVGSQMFLPCTDGLRQVLLGSDHRLTLGWHAPGQVSGSPIVGGIPVFALNPIGPFSPF